MPQIQKFSKTQVPDQPDNVYYDLIITNIQSEKTAPVPISYNENRINPIINNTGDYILSIIRFSVDTQSLPVFVPFIQTGALQTDPNLTIYSVTLTYTAGGTTYYAQEYIEWIPQDKSATVAPPPSQNGGLQSTSGFYYFCYNYQWWCYLVLIAFQNAFTSLQSKVTGAGHSFPNTSNPVFSFDTNTDCAVISAESQYYDNTNSNPINIYFNNPLYQLFSSFPAVYNGTGSTKGTDYQILIDNFGGTSQIYLPNIAPSGTTQIIATQAFQEYSTVSNWTPVSGIVFVSNTIPIVSNGLSAPLVFNEASVQSVFQGNNANFAQIITDLETNQNCYKPNLLYSPTAEYRRISMVGNAPLTNIDVTVFWKNRVGELIPLYLASGGTATLKFLFEKKGAKSKLVE